MAHLVYISISAIRKKIVFNVVNTSKHNLSCTACEVKENLLLLTSFGCLGHRKRSKRNEDVQEVWRAFLCAGNGYYLL